MGDKLDRVITESGKIFGIACDTTSLVNEACRRHDLGPTAAAALGRALTGAILLAGLLKDDQRVQLIFEGNGPLGKVISEADSSGKCRGYVVNPHADVALKDGRIDVAAGIGKAGFLRVIKDIGLEKEYTSLVQLYTSEVGEDIAFYLTESEQTPSTISLGVHFEGDGTVLAAGGFLIQSLPPADEQLLRELEESAGAHASVTGLLAEGKTPAEILQTIFAAIPHKPTGSTELSFSCRCSREKMLKVLTTLSVDDLQYLLELDDDAEAKCDYCNTSYRFTKAELLAITSAKKS